MIIEFWKEGLNPITCYKTSREINRSPERMNLDTPSLNKISCLLSLIKPQLRRRKLHNAKEYRVF